jgi:16S rRNA (cytosine967-C5)-methyltransferase
VQTQAGLLEKASGLVRPGGLIGYSTCSIQEAEDAGVVQTFLPGHPGFQLESERLTLPSAGPFDHDGGYVAVLRRTQAA